MCQHRPDRSCHLVGRDHHHIGWPALTQFIHPRARLLGMCQHRTGTVDEQCSQVGVAALADAQQPRLATRAGLLGHQSHPGGKLPPRLEGLGIPHRRYRRRGGQQTDTGNVGNGFGRLVCQSQLLSLSSISATCASNSTMRCHCSRKASITMPGNRSSTCASAAAIPLRSLALRHHLTVLSEQSSQCIDLHGAHLD